MKTPKEVAQIQLEARVAEEVIDAKLNQQIREALIRSLDYAMDWAIQKGTVTSNGGRVRVSFPYGFSPERERIAHDYFREHGWESDYYLEKDREFHLLTREEIPIERYVFFLKPSKP